MGHIPYKAKFFYALTKPLSPPNAVLNKIIAVLFISKEICLIWFDNECITKFYLAA